MCILVRDYGFVSISKFSQSFFLFICNINNVINSIIGYFLKKSLWDRCGRCLWGKEAEVQFIGSFRREFLTWFVQGFAVDLNFKLCQSLQTFFQLAHALNGQLRHWISFLSPMSCSHSIAQFCHPLHHVHIYHTTIKTNEISYKLSKTFQYN